MMYTTILLAFDGTIEGREALHQGSEIASHFHSETHLLAVMRLPLSNVVPEMALPSEIMQETVNEVQKIVDDGVQELKLMGINAHGHIATGEPIEEIAAQARKLKADLLVVGLHQRGRSKRWWQGSVGRSLVEVAPCSILIAV